MLRSGAYSDEIVRNLITRRFVAVMYDVAPPERNAGDGWAYDPRAVDVLGDVRKMRPISGSRGARQLRDGTVEAGSYPAALFALPDGTHLGEGLWGILSPEQFVAELKAVMAKWPGHFKPTRDERAVERAAAENPDDWSAQLALARQHWHLARFEDVLSCRAPIRSTVANALAQAELDYLRARSLTCLDRDEEARTALTRAERGAVGELATAVTVARARLEMRANDHEQALSLLLPLTDYQAPGKWTGTAMYYAGLCHYRLGDTEAAKTMWRRHRNELPFDRMARRSAGSLGSQEVRAFMNQELLQTDGWW